MSRRVGGLTRECSGVYTIYRPHWSFVTVTEKKTRRRGRPPKKGPKRIHNMMVKLTATEKEEIWEAARKNNMTLSDFVRNCVRDVCDHGFTQPVQKL